MPSTHKFKNQKEIKKRKEKENIYKQIEKYLKCSRILHHILYERESQSNGSKAFILEFIYLFYVKLKSYATLKFHLWCGKWRFEIKQLKQTLANGNND